MYYVTYTIYISYPLYERINQSGGAPFNVEILHLGENLLKTFAELDKITFWPLKELVLEGNLIREYVDKRERDVKVRERRTGGQIKEIYAMDPIPQKELSLAA